MAVDLRASWAGDSDIASLAEIPTLRRLDLSQTRISDHGLRQLKSAPAIADLNLRYAELITDEGISALKTWKHLKRLDVEGTKVTDSTLRHFSDLSTLEALNIGYVLVTDAGLEAQASLTHLKELTLGGNKLTDAGLQPLRELPGLTFLDLGGAQRTDSGLWSVSFTEPGLAAIGNAQGSPPIATYGHVDWRTRSRNDQKPSAARTAGLTRLRAGCGRRHPAPGRDANTSVRGPHGHHGKPPPGLRTCGEPGRTARPSWRPRVRARSPRSRSISLRQYLSQLPVEGWERTEPDPSTSSASVTYRLAIVPIVSVCLPVARRPACPATIIARPLFLWGFASACSCTKARQQWSMRLPSPSGVDFGRPRPMRVTILFPEGRDR